MNNKPKTLFIDIDGVLFHHCGSGNAQAKLKKPALLPGVLNKFDEWDRKGYRLILVTGRHESVRVATERQLFEAGIVYDQLIMGLGGGNRVVINDFKPNSTIPTAEAICLERNKGLEAVNV